MLVEFSILVLYSSILCDELNDFRSLIGCQLSSSKHGHLDKCSIGFLCAMYMIVSVFWQEMMIFV